MAKLTARFELEDRVSKKLLRIQKRFQTFEKQLKPFRKPVKISLEMDEKKLRNLTLSLRKISAVSMTLDQGIYRDLKSLKNQLNMLPNYMVISIQAKGLDVIKTSIDRLRQVGTSPIMMTFKLNDQLSSKISSIKKSILQLINRTYYMRLNMVDQATAAIQRIKKTLKSLTMSKHEIRVSVQDNAKSKLKKRDQAESVVKEKKVKKQPNATAATKTNENKQSWLGNLGNKALKEIEKYAGDVTDKLKEKLSPRKFWDEKALPWIETKIDEYKQEVIGRISEKIKINPEDYLDNWVNKGLDWILGPKNQTNDSGGSNDNASSGQPGNQNSDQTQNEKGLFRVSCCSCCAKGLNPTGTARTDNRNGPRNQPNNPTGTSRVEKNRKPPTKLGGLTKKIPGVMAIAGLAGMFKDTEKLKGLGDTFKNLGKGAGKLLKKVPILGPLLSATELIGTTKENVGEKVGGFGGGVAGGIGGAAIGTMIAPGIGTAIGGILGSILGESLGKWIGKMFDDGTLKKKWDDIVKGAENAVKWIKDIWNKVSSWINNNVLIPITSFFGETWNWITEKWGQLSSWFMEKVWLPIYNFSVPIINFVVGVFDVAWTIIKNIWAVASKWFMDYVWEPFGQYAVEAIGWVWNKLVDTWNWIQETWGVFSEWFLTNVWDPFGQYAIEAIGWVWNKFVETWNWIQETWSVFSEWFNEYVWTPFKTYAIPAIMFIWNLFQNTWNWIQEKWGAFSEWFNEYVWTPFKTYALPAITFVWNLFQNTWNWIKTTWEKVSTWFDENVWQPYQKYAKPAIEFVWEKFNEAWETIKGIWEKVSSWFEEKVFNPLKKHADTLKKTWEGIFGVVGNVFDTAKNIGGNLLNIFIKKGEEKTGLKSSEKAANNATGGYITQPTLSWVGEAGNEFVIPTQNNRGRGKMLLAQAASHLGMSVMPSGAAGNQVSSSPAPTAVAASSSVGSIDGSVSMTGDIQASSIGEQFNDDFEQGLNRKVISLDQWKQKNIQQPFGQLTSDSGKYGQQTVSAFANGQQMTPTGTASFLQSRVKTPYQQVMTASPTWGSGTVSGFAAGQNATSTGTSQYVDQHIKQPFLQAKQESPGWGSGMIDAFNSGMRSKGSEVTQAAKEMAKKVEQAFREELDIHSPSRVMMSLGKFASIGVVKGLDSVDVKKFAENQAGSLIGAFSGMGASNLNVKQWLMAAIMATGTSMSWLPGLMTIAQNESHGDPRAINLWDSNAKKGTPSKGLMQTIGTTFNANKGKGMNDIWNPIHNAVAAINYIKGRYGTVFNTPGLRSMRRGGPYKGYANGGLITQEQVARVGEGNKREWIIPEERGIRGRYLLTQAAKALGMQVYDPSNASAPLPEAQMHQVTSAQSTGSTTSSSGNKQITIQFNGDQHFHNGQDQQSLVEKIKQMLVDELEVELHTGTKGVVIDG
ncbi:transglycosylase SLT domain-containing protein [Bacillus safensis]|uniref:transglycosylase SLT domain-containing protein n=1 Tax=Bacillus safensis TaxID=561879 RepID=UPI0035188593